MQNRFKKTTPLYGSPDVRQHLPGFSPEKNSLYLEPTRFPTLHELSQAQPEPLPKREKGLFETLIQNPAVLHQDLISHPTKYDESLLPLLQRLLVEPSLLGRLNGAERELLDLAVHDYTRAAPKSKSPPPPPQTSKQEPHEPEYQLDEPLELDGLKPYWWL